MSSPRSDVDAFRGKKRMGMVCRGEAKQPYLFSYWERGGTIRFLDRYELPPSVNGQTNRWGRVRVYSRRGN